MKAITAKDRDGKPWASCPSCGWRLAEIVFVDATTGSYRAVFDNAWRSLVADRANRGMAAFRAATYEAIRAQDPDAEIVSAGRPVLLGKLEADAERPLPETEPGQPENLLVRGRVRHRGGRTLPAPIGTGRNFRDVVAECARCGERIEVMTGPRPETPSHPAS